MRDAGFSQVMLSARDLAGHAERRRCGGARRASERPARHRLPGAARLRGPVRPPARLQGRHRQVDARDVRARSARRVLLVCSSTSTHADADPDALARDLRKLAMLAMPLGIKVAYEGLSWGRTINEFTAGVGRRVPRRRAQPRPRASIRSTCSRPRRALDDLDAARPRQDLPRAAGRLHVAGDAHVRGAHRHRAPLPRVPRRRRAQRRSSPSW